MEQPLNEYELNYVFEHMDLMMDTNVWRDQFCYSEVSESKNQIIVIPNHGDLSEKMIDDLPVLFATDEKNIYSIDKKGNLVFYHDLLKSAFYLLSSYDEQFVNRSRDHWGRVSYHTSIQKRLGIIHRPVVNEYFDLILEGVNAFMKHHKRPPLVRSKFFKSFGFLLSHDIDVIDKYGWNHLGYKIKELLGVVKSEHNKWKILKVTAKSALQFLNPWRSNPYWNFPYLLNLEQGHKIRSSYYFLAKDQEGGSHYNFDEKRLVQLFKKLKGYKHEIGIHGTTQTVNNRNKLSKEVDDLEKAAGVKIYGGRQHRLWLDYPNTFKNHSAIGLRYDSSFGFAEMEGFRNSFCLPFKPYDFENRQAIDLWQLPLVTMDVTLFSYRLLSADDAFSIIEKLLDEVKKHNGIFTLLWHNSFFDEILYPGITNIYESILELIVKETPNSISGKKLVELLEEKHENTSAN